MVAYTSGKPGRIYVASVNGGSPKMIVDGQNLYAWDWSLDNRRLLFDMPDGPRVHVADVLARHEKVLLAKPGYGLFQAKFSPDDLAIALIGCWSAGGDAPQCQIFVAPIESGAPAAPERWMAIDHSGRWDDKPRWSPNGKLIYFISDRDGYFCLWAQRVESRTKRLIGTPFAVYHFHNSRLSMANVADVGVLEFDVAKDKIVFGLGELTGNIWSLRKK
jgi:eukaryotic-like serine/threonine-protein kinase